MRAALKSFSFKLFRASQRVGLFVLPTHYYVPLAGVGELDRTRETWAVKSDLPGIDADLDRQLATLGEMCRPYRDEYADNAAYREGMADLFGPGYGWVEAQALHAVVRHVKPRRIIEVGSGVSTYCMAHALALNEAEGAERADLTCIEPYPSDALRGLTRANLRVSRVQDTPLEVFLTLQKGDFLFIDSSHAVKPGSDVNFLILEVLPRLNPGVVVHVHDIYLPYDYPRDVLTTYFQWMETSLLRAYMTHNDRIRVQFCLSQLHYERPDVLQSLFPGYRPAPDVNGMDAGGRVAEGETHFPASIYLETA